MTFIGWECRTHGEADKRYFLKNTTLALDKPGIECASLEQVAVPTPDTGEVVFSDVPGVAIANRGLVEFLRDRFNFSAFIGWEYAVDVDDDDGYDVLADYALTLGDALALPDKEDFMEEFGDTLYGGECGDDDILSIDYIYKLRDAVLSKDTDTNYALIAVYHIDDSSPTLFLEDEDDSL